MKGIGLTEGNVTLKTCIGGIHFSAEKPWNLALSENIDISELCKNKLIVIL